MLGSEVLDEHSEEGRVSPGRPARGVLSVASGQGYYESMGGLSKVGE